MAARKQVQLIIGLGNYAFPTTRHSIGMRLCDWIATQYGLSWIYRSKYKGYVAEMSACGNHYILFKSNLFMNLSGRSVKMIAEDVHLTNIYALHDDLDRPFGKVNWKTGGSASGHKGVKSVMAALQTDNFKRLKLGIGRPEDSSLVSLYVLSDFSQIETSMLGDFMRRSFDCLRLELLETETTIQYR